MSRLNTQWNITVTANTAAANTQLQKFAATAQAAGTSVETMMSNVKGGPATMHLKNMGNQLDRMNTQVIRGKANMGSFNKYWRNSNNLIRKSKQLQSANVIAMGRSNKAINQATLAMRDLDSINVTTGERLAYMNTWFRSSSQQAINWAKNLQWSGRQIMVGFTLPFGVAMAGASMAFLDFEKQLVRFRKVFNTEINDLSIEEAENRLVGLSNTMATQLGIARKEVMETSAMFAQMGYEVEEIERLTRETTELALLGETDSQEAGKLLRAYSASGFVETFEESDLEGTFEKYIKDMLNAIENNTGLSVSDMVESGMAQLVPLFSQQGIGIGVGESILAGMNEALGGRTNEAVTSLKTIMQRVYDESAETTEQFDILGVDIESLQKKYTDDFRGLMTELGNILQDNPELENNNKLVAETFGNLFGIRQSNRAIAGIRAVANGFDDAGEATNDYARALGSYEDQAEISANSTAELQAQAESLGGRLNRVKEQIIIAAADIGETFLEFVLPIGEFIGRIIESFTSMDESTQRMIIGIGGFISVIGVASMTIGVLIQGVLQAARAFSAFLPKFTIMDEAIKRNQVSMTGLDSSLDKLTTTLARQEPMYESIEQAHREMARAMGIETSATNRLAQAQGRLSTSQRAASQSATGGYYRSGRGWRSTSTGSFASADDVYRAGGGYGPGRQQFANNSAGTWKGGQFTPASGAPAAGGGGSSVKWRGGAGAAGAVLGAGGMLMGNELGSAMFGAGIALEGAAIMGPKIQQAIQGWSSGLGNVASRASGLRSSLAGSASSLLGMIGSTGGLAIAFAGIAAAGFAFKQHLEESKVVTNQIRNEFLYAAEIADEVGLKIGSSFQGLGEELVSGEELENMSDGMKSLIADIDSAQVNGRGSVQAIFRNLARQWQAGGASIEEINEKLKELEAVVNVEIDPVSRQSLISSLEEDITNAINNSFSNVNPNTTGRFNLANFLFDNNLGDGAPSWISGSRFGPQGDAQLQGNANLLAQSASDALSTPENSAALAAAIQEIRGNMESLGSDAEHAKEEIISMMAEPLQINADLVSSFDSIEEVMSYYYTSLRRNKEYTANLTEDELARLDEQIELYGRYDGITSESANALRSLDALGTVATGRMHEIVQGLSLAGGELGLLNPELESFADITENMTRDKMSEFILKLYDLAESADLSEVEVRRLLQAAEALNAELGRARGFEYNAGGGYWEGAGRDPALDVKRREDAQRAAAYAHRGDSMSNVSPEGTRGGASTAEEAIAAQEAADEKAKGQLRSELDKMRQEVIDEQLEMFDDASDQRMETLENERDSRIEYLEDARDAAIEGIEAERDARLDALEDAQEAEVEKIEDRQERETEALEEARDKAVETFDDRIDKIDEYIEKQNELEESMQSQIDLAAAIAGGDLAKAAQIQNSMRFGDVENAADEVKESIKEEQEEVKQTYDERIKNQKDLHDDEMEKVKKRQSSRLEGARDYYDRRLKNAKSVHDKRIADSKSLFTRRISNEKKARVAQRETMEQNLRDLESMFIGTRDGWNRFLNRVERTTGRQIPQSLRNGFNTAMTQVANDIRRDRLWENVQYGELRKGTKGAIYSGAMQGLTAFEAKWYNYLDSKNSADRKFFETPDNKESFKNFINRHSGGPVGGGPKRDVPAVLQTGEYVIQRDAAQRLGQPLLDNINQYHKGGAVHDMGHMVGNMTAMSGFKPPVDPEPAPGQSTIQYAATTSALQPPDADRTWRYSNWTVNMLPSIMAKFATALARLAGGQTVTSAYRSPSENRRIGGAPNSDHTKGKGIDFVSQSGNSLGKLNSMGSYFQRQPGVRWVGMPSTDPSGGHNDHVHVSYYHGGGSVAPMGLMKGGRLKANNVPAMLHRGETVLRAPVSKDLERGIQNMSKNVQRTINLNIGEFHGSEENIDMLVRKVNKVNDREYRTTNRSKRFS